MPRPDLRSKEPRGLLDQPILVHRRRDGINSLTIVSGMMGRISLKLTTKQRHYLRALSADHRSRPGFRRARVILPVPKMWQDARSHAVSIFPEQVSRIRTRFRAEGVAGWTSVRRPDVRIMRSQRPRSSKSYSWRCRPHLRGVADGRHGSSRDGWGSPAVACRMYSVRNGLKPHLSRTYKVSRDPEFANEGQGHRRLYLSPPEHAVVLSVDERRRFRLSSERNSVAAALGSRVETHARLQAPWRRGSLRSARDCDRQGHLSFERYAHGGRLHRFHEIAWFENIRHKNSMSSSTTRRRTETADVMAWPAEHPRVQFHYTPTSASCSTKGSDSSASSASSPLAKRTFLRKKALREHVIASLRFGIGTRRPLRGPSQQGHYQLTPSNA